MEAESIIVFCFILLIFAGAYLFIVTRSSRNRDGKGKKADSGTYIRSDIIGERPLTDRSEKDKTVKTGTEEPKRAIRTPAVRAEAARAESFPRIIYNYFPLASMEEGELWVCRNCEVENSAEQETCFLCGASREES